MLRVATVLSAREWEARFVAAARDSAAVRLVLRAYLPDEVASQASDLDVVVAGAETPWVTSTRVASWRRLGLRVVGVHPRLDRPAAERLAAGGADLVIEDGIGSDEMVREIRLLEASARPDAARNGSVTVVTGARGAPGRTEIATALAWASAGARDTALVDADLVAPAVAIRLGLPGRPDLADCVDLVLDGARPVEGTQVVGRLRVASGAMRDTGIRPESALDVAEDLAGDHAVIVDAGPIDAAEGIVRSADRVVLVVEATPTGIVRGADVVADWVGPVPLLVLNKASSDRRSDVETAVRRWCGLEPAQVVPVRRSIALSAAQGRPPHRSILKPAARLTGEVFGG